MNHFFCTFTDFKSLQEFIGLKPINDDPDNLEVENWRHCYRFLMNDTSYKLNEEKFAVLNNDLDVYPLFRKLANRYFGGDESIILKPNLCELTPAEFISISKQEKFVISEISRLPKLSEENTGCIIKDPTEFISNWRLLRDDTPFFVSKYKGVSKQLTSWDEVGNYMLPLNAIVICDNYILSNSLGVEYNLLKLLQILLQGKKLDVTFDITILTKSFYPPIKDKIDAESKKDNTIKTLDKIKEETPIEDVFKRISEGLKKILGHDFFNLTIVKREVPDYHDRYIFTNYFVLNSGNGFQYFSQSGKTITPHFTEFKVIPITKRKEQADNFTDMLSQIQMMIEDTPKDKIMGSCKNRLLEL